MSFDLMFKFHDDLTVNKSEIVVLFRHVWLLTGKRESFERGKRENESKRKEERVDVF